MKTMSFKEIEKAILKADRVKSEYKQASIVIVRNIFESHEKLNEVLVNEANRACRGDYFEDCNCRKFKGKCAKSLCCYWQASSEV